MTKDNLNLAFEEAKSSNARFIFVGVDADGVKEVIAIPSRSFEKKQEFYNTAYSNDLIHVMNKNVHIYGVSHGDEKALYQLI